MLLAPLSVATAANALAPAELNAQTDVTLELGASQIGPVAGLDVENARYAVAGVRGSHYGLSGSGVFGSVLGGHAFGDVDGGDFVTLDVGALVLDQLTRTLHGSLDLRFLAFGVTEPYPYTAVAVEGGPALRVDVGPLSLEVAGLAGLGSSSFELQGPLGRTRRFTDELRRLGATTEVTLGHGMARLGFMGGYHDTPGGTFTSGGANLLLLGSWGAVELRGDVWSTPTGTETTGGLAMVIALSGWSLRGFFGRNEPDPLTLAQPGGTGGGIFLGRSLYARDLGSSGAPPPWEVISTTPDGVTIRIAIEAPEGARSVALLGDFTLWDSVPMQLRDGRWEAEVAVAEGTHHYGFLVDDEWYVPADMRDVVPDEWGRSSAILVIEGVD